MARQYASRKAPTEGGYIVRSGCGGFLNPPGHPSHTFSVYEGPRRDPRSIMSLESTIGAEWLSEKVRAEAKALLDGWAAEETALTPEEQTETLMQRGYFRLTLSAPAVQEWILQVLGYFRGCYRNPNVDGLRQWAVSDLIINRDRNPLEYLDEHAGVRLIRQYYPGFAPTAEHFGGAYWGTKPAKAV
jgi:hypothetical protein